MTDSSSAAASAGITALRHATLVLQGINRLVLSLCKYLTIGLVASIAVIICVGVFWRYVLNDAISWSEEVSKFLMVWLTFVGAPIALKQGGHVAIELLPDMLPRKLREIAHIVVFLIVLALMAVFVHYGTVLALNARSQVAATLQDVSMMWVFLAIPAGGAMMFLVGLELAIGGLRTLLGDPVDESHAELRDVVRE